MPQRYYVVALLILVIFLSQINLFSINVSGHRQKECYVSVFLAH